MKLALKGLSLPLREFALEADVILERRSTAIFGPSGAGKTSLLDVIAGLRRPASAWIEFNGRLLADTARGVDLPPRLRRIGYVSQDLALFPHLSVRNNLLYGSRGGGAGGDVFSYDHVTRVLEIGPLAERAVTELSGGEQQRVALARALLASPQLLLLDEPLASLDSALKTRIIPYLARVRDEFGTPMLYVTHDRAEARALCEEVLEMWRGKIVKQIGMKEWTE